MEIRLSNAPKAVYIMKSLEDSGSILGEETGLKSTKGYGVSLESKYFVEDGDTYSENSLDTFNCQFCQGKNGIIDGKFWNGSRWVIGGNSITDDYLWSCKQSTMNGFGNQQAGNIIWATLDMIVPKNLCENQCYNACFDSCDNGCFGRVIV